MRRGAVDRRSWRGVGANADIVVGMGVKVAPRRTAACRHCGGMGAVGRVAEQRRRGSSSDGCCCGCFRRIQRPRPFAASCSSSCQSRANGSSVCLGKHQSGRRHVGHGHDLLLGPFLGCGQMVRSDSGSCRGRRPLRNCWRLNGGVKWRFLRRVRWMRDRRLVGMVDVGLLPLGRLFAVFHCVFGGECFVSHPCVCRRKTKLDDVDEIGFRATGSFEEVQLTC